MSYTYDIADTTVATSDESHPKTRAREVSKAFQDFFNVDPELVDWLSVAGHIDGFSGSEGVIPDMSDEANELVYSGFKHFSVKEELAGYFGESRGPSNVTSMVVKYDLDVRQVMAVLVENGGMARAWREVREMTLESDPAEEKILALVFLKYSLGWDAEKILDQSDDFKKASVSEDKGGIDGYYKGERVQVRPVTWVGSYGRQKAMNEDRTFVSYTWDCDGGMRVARLGDMLEMLQEVADENDLYKSCLYSSKRMKTSGLTRAFRYLWF